MPQLLPAPWFFIFAASWLILLTIAPQKVLSYKLMNDLNHKSAKLTKMTWPWPWL